MLEPHVWVRVIGLALWATGLIIAFRSRRARRAPALIVAWVLILLASVGGAILFHPQTVTQNAPAYAAVKALPAYHVIAPGEVILTEVVVTPIAEAVPSVAATPAATITATVSATATLAAPTTTPIPTPPPPLAENPTGWLLLAPVEAGAVISASQVISLSADLIPQFVIEIPLAPDGESGQTLQPGDLVDIYAVARPVAEGTTFTLTQPDLPASFPITRTLVLHVAADASRVTLGLSDQMAVQRLIEAQPWVTFYLAWRR